MIETDARFGCYLDLGVTRQSATVPRSVGHFSSAACAYASSPGTCSAITWAAWSADWKRRTTNDKVCMVYDAAQQPYNDDGDCAELGVAEG